MKLAIAICPRCSLEFALNREVLVELVELTCPRCERVFGPNDDDQETGLADGEPEELGEEDDEAEADGELDSDEDFLGDKNQRARIPQTGRSTVR